MIFENYVDALEIVSNFWGNKTMKALIIDCQHVLTEQLPPLPWEEVCDNQERYEEEWGKYLIKRKNVQLKKRNITSYGGC